MSIYSDDDDGSLADDMVMPSVPHHVVPNKLRIIVLYNAPWGPVPGAAVNPPAVQPNQQPAASQVPVSAGLPWRTQIVAQPLTLGTPLLRRLNPAASATVMPGWDRVYNVPSAVVAKYHAALKDATSFTFDFGRPGKLAASGKLTAYSKKGSAAAEIAFTYAWQRRHGRSCVTFKIDKCIARNARFTLLSAIDEFTPPPGSSTEPFVPIIVLGLQQWRLGADADDDIGIEDARGEFYPVCCSDTSLDFMTLHAFSSHGPA